MFDWLARPLGRQPSRPKPSELVVRRKPIDDAQVKWPETEPSSRDFFDAHWYRCWSAAFVPSEFWQGPVNVLQVEDRSGSVLGALPLARQKVSFVEFAALGGYYQPFRGFPVLDRHLEQVCVALADHLTWAESIPALRLGPVQETDPAVQQLLARLKQRGWMIHEMPDSFEYVAHLPASTEGHYRMLSSKMAKKVKYESRRFKREGGTVEVVHRAAAAEWNAAIREMAAIEQRSWLSSDPHGKPRFIADDSQRFWSALLGDEHASAAFRVWLLRFEGQAVCFALTLDAHTCRHLLASNYVEDDRVKKYSPGTVLYDEILRHAVDNGMRLVNMGGGDAGYKTRWSARPDMPLKDYVVFSPSPAGAGLYIGLSAKEMLSSLRDAWTQSRRSPGRHPPDTQ